MSSPRARDKGTSYCAWVRDGVFEKLHRLGRYRWKIEHTIAWLTGYRRITIRYERYGEHFAGFLHLTAALTCFKKFPTWDALSLNAPIRLGPK